jgi:hypothetical protein
MTRPQSGVNRGVEPVARDETISTPGYLWISEEISLALAPVFLLSAIATILILLSGRMGRIADRFNIEENQGAKSRSQTMKVLLRRMRLIQSAILSAVLAGLSISTVTVLIFLSDTIVKDLSAVIVTVFIASMGFIWISLVLYLIEVSYSAARTARDLSD